IGTGRTLSADPLPMMAIPTTSGTGSEATKNSVISCSDPPCKTSLRSEKLVPSVVLIDPELTVTLPPQQTAHSGMDAITQLIESMVSRRSQPGIEFLCRMVLTRKQPRIIDALVTAYREPNHRESREIMAWAALASGIALANSGL